MTSWKRSRKQDGQRRIKRSLIHVRDLAHYVGCWLGILPIKK